MNSIAIGPFGARIYWMETRRLKDDAYFQKNYEMLSPARQKKIDAYRFRKDKNLSLAAGMLFAQGLSRYGVKEADAAVGYGGNGKPYLTGLPYIHFNLSHSEGMALAVFAEVEAGCDVEWVQHADLALANKFFCPGEYSYVAGQAGGREKDQAFYRIWTLKESFLKATGLGLSLPLDEFEVQVGIDGAVAVRQQVDGSAYQFWEYQFGAYQAAVCLRG